MALASFNEARSVTELSLSPLYHYQFSSITRSIDSLATDDQERLVLEQDIVAHCLQYAPEFGFAPGVRLIQTDTTSLCKPHAPTLAERTYVHTADNTVAGNRPISVGYTISAINLSASGWSLPLSLRRVKVDRTASDCALEQLADLMPQLMPHLGAGLLVNTLDSNYGKAAYLARAYAYENMVSIVRIRSGIKVFRQPVQLQGAKGCPLVYGAEYYVLLKSRHRSYLHPKTKVRCYRFQRALFEQDADEQSSLEERTKRGRKLTVRLARYKNMRIRTKDGHNMKHKPFDIVLATVFDGQTMIYSKPLVIAVSGKRKGEISTEDAYRFYRKRYDIEPYFRFAKQRLLLGRYQTSKKRHLENWLLIVQLASWLLYSASKEVHFRPRKWERSQQRVFDRETIARTRRSVAALFLTFEPSQFKPQKRKKGKGREQGVTFEPRMRYRVQPKMTAKAIKSRKYAKKR